MDYRASKLGRKRSWYGLKKYVKRFFGWRVPHFGLRVLTRFKPALRKDGRLPAPANIKEVRASVDHDCSFVMTRPDRCIIAKELYWGNGRRPRPEDNLAVKLIAQAARRADVMLDIGAYTGLMTLAATKSNPKLEAHAFEIVPEVYSALFDNCVRNDVLHRTTLHPIGVGRPDAEMRVPANSNESALPSFYSEKLSFENGTLVRFRSLDSFAEVVTEGRKTLMKIDVEGTEDDIFRDGQRFLSMHKPEILCEVLPEADGEELQELLAPHGYLFYLVRSDDLLLCDRIEPNERYRDWFFTTSTEPPA